MASVYLHIPDLHAVDLSKAEHFVASRDPDFTFVTPVIDFPPGPMPVALDTEFPTVGDFLGDLPVEISDPTKLGESFGNVLIEFEGYIRIDPAADLNSEVGLPVLLDVGMIGYDGFRLEIGPTIYSFYNMWLQDDAPGFFWREHAIIQAYGVFPITVTWFNRFDDDAEADPPNSPWHAEYAGIEVYTWLSDGIESVMGDRMTHPLVGPATLLSDHHIFELEEVMDLMPADYDANAVVDLADWRWFQSCFGEVVNFPTLPLQCESFDMDGDGDVDWQDVPHVNEYFGQ
ncbi:MAG: hypothetical protein ACPGXK_15930 [Phycisphaerae bacterium]